LNFKVHFSETKAVSLIVVTAFFVYFISEAVLRQYVLSQVGAKKLSINAIISHLPESIQEQVKKKITKGRLQDKLDTATTDTQIISVSIALAKLESKQKVAETYAMIVEKFPSSPRTAEALFFFFRSKSKLKHIFTKDIHNYIARLPKDDRFSVWQRGYAKLKRTHGTAEEREQFLLPLLQITPPFKDYKQLYFALIEAASDLEHLEIENKARNMVNICGKLKSRSFIMQNKNRHNPKKKK